MQPSGSVIRLYPGAARGSEHWTHHEQEIFSDKWTTQVVFNVTDPPPLFALAATDDALGLAPQSVHIYNDWVAAGKSAELHLYAKGGHGFGMRTQNLPSDHWIELFYAWQGGQGLLQP
jgi:hypothetical protein